MYFEWDGQFRNCAPQIKYFCHIKFKKGEKNVTPLRPLKFSALYLKRFALVLMQAFSF